MCAKRLYSCIIPVQVTRFFRFLVNPELKRKTFTIRKRKLFSSISEITIDETLKRPIFPDSAGNCSDIRSLLIKRKKLNSSGKNYGKKLSKVNAKIDRKIARYNSDAVKKRISKSGVMGKGIFGHSRKDCYQNHTIFHMHYKVILEVKSQILLIYRVSIRQNLSTG